MDLWIEACLLLRHHGLPEGEQEVQRLVDLTLALVGGNKDKVGEETLWIAFERLTGAAPTNR
jgi:hypothetical protein